MIGREKRGVIDWVCSLILNPARLENVSEFKEDIHRATVAKEVEKRPFEPRDTVFIGQIGAHLLDHHIGRKRFGADVGTVGT
jgi:hypothetical protein